MNVDYFNLSNEHLSNDVVEPYLIKLFKNKKNLKITMFVPICHINLNYLMNRFLIFLLETYWCETQCGDSLFLVDFTINASEPNWERMNISQEAQFNFFPLHSFPVSHCPVMEKSGSCYVRNTLLDEEGINLVAKLLPPAALLTPYENEGVTERDAYKPQSYSQWSIYKWRSSDPVMKYTLLEEE